MTPFCPCACRKLAAHAKSPAALGEPGSCIRGRTGATAQSRRPCCHFAQTDKGVTLPLGSTPVYSGFTRLKVPDPACCNKQYYSQLLGILTNGTRVCQKHALPFMMTERRTLRENNLFYCRCTSMNHKNVISLFCFKKIIFWRESVNRA